jgi:hypothetical protein
VRKAEPEAQEPEKRPAMPQTVKAGKIVTLSILVFLHALIFDFALNQRFADDFPHKFTFKLIISVKITQNPPCVFWKFILSSFNKLQLQTLLCWRAEIDKNNPFPARPQSTRWSHVDMEPQGISPETTKTKRSHVRLNVGQ